MNELQILDQIEQTSGSKAKQEILEANKDNRRIFELFNSAFNFFKKYHIKKIEVSQFNPHQISDMHNDFMKILHALEFRQVTGNKAKMLVENFLAQCNAQQQKWYTRVIQKDLKIGVSISTANKCGFNIPKFDVMLAKDAKKMKKARQVVEKGVYVSPKLDGYRCLMIWDGETVSLYSRNGKLYENFAALQETLTNVFKTGFSPMVLDGEIMSDDFQSMQKSAFASVRGTTVGDMVYHVFGWVCYDEWMDDNFEKTTAERYEHLSGMFEKMQLEKNTRGQLKLVPQKYTESWDEILELEAQYLRDGLEGAMALPADAPYYKGRKTNMLMKFKTFHTQDCTVEDYYEGTGKYSGSLGGVRVRQEDGQTICGVGSGFTDEERQRIYSNFESVRGRIIEVRYQELTDDGVMRFPTFVRFRDQGDGSKI
jgi:DNA ligase-1